MENKTKCPDFEKMLKVTAKTEKVDTVTLKLFTEIKTDWSVIKTIKSTLEVGDEITCKLKDGRQVTFVVAALNPYGDNQVVFVIKDCIGEHQINKENTNEGGWSKCEMRRYLNEDIFDLLPDDLQAVIKPRKLKTKDTALDTEDRLWLLSKMEVFGTESGAELGDIHFPLFATERDHVKNDADGETCYWWLRSPITAYSHNFWSVVTNGSSSNNYASSSNGVAFGFLI